jgi:hypothetical protein
MPGAMTKKQNVPTIAAVLFIRSFHLHGPAVRKRLRVYRKFRSTRYSAAFSTAILDVLRGK